MNEEALALPLLLFLRPLKLSHLFFSFLLAVTFWKTNGEDSYDQFIARMLSRFNPASDYCLVLSRRKIKTTRAVVYWPSVFEDVPEIGKEIYGLVIIDNGKDDVATYLLNYSWNSLCYGGKILIVHEGHVLTVLEKN